MDQEEVQVKSRGKILLESVLWGAGFYLLTFCIFLLVGFFSVSGFREVSRLFGTALMFPIPIFIIFSITSYNTIKSKERQSGKIAFSRNLYFLLISSIALAVLLNGLMMIPCRGICSGESAMAYFMITGFIAAYFVIGIIFSSLFSWVYFSLRGKGTAILLVALIILALLIGFGKFYYNGFCLTGDEGCYFERAFAAGDPTICERAWISESCYLAYARTQEDESFCDKYLNDGPLDGSYARSSCYSDFAIRKNDPELCKKVNMDWARSGCCSQVFNLEDIKDLTAEQKVACGMGL